MGIDNESTGSALKKEMHLSYPVSDEVTGEVVTDPDGFPIAELESDDYLELANTLTIEERSRGERAWRFGHVIVDEAQDLTPMQWRMVSRRARGRSMTIVGDVAQRTVGESATWDQLLPKELGDVRRFDLSTNYRSPEEITPWASAVLREIDSGLTQPLAIRSSGHPVEVVQVEGEELAARAVKRANQYANAIDGGQVAILAMDNIDVEHERIRVLTPGQSKGMEFDAVVVVEPAAILAASHGPGLLYVALTRSTDRLTVLHTAPLPEFLPVVV